MKRSLSLILTVALSLSLFGCGKTESKGGQTTQAGNAENSALNEKFENYMNSFTDELDDYLEGDFTKLIDEAKNDDSTEWVDLFVSGKEKIGHMSSEYSGASMIVPESGKKEYNAVANVVSALENLFTLYSDLAEAEKATEDKRNEFCEAAEAILVVWDTID